MFRTTAEAEGEGLEEVNQYKIILVFSWLSLPGNYRMIDAALLA